MLQPKHVLMQEATSAEEPKGGTPPEEIPNADSGLDDLESPDPVFDEFLEGTAAGGKTPPPESGVGAAPAPGEASPPPTSQAPKPEAPKPAAVPPKEPEAAPPPAPVAAEPKPPVPVATEAPAPVQPARTEEQLTSERAEHRKAYLSELEQKYTIPEDQHDTLLTSPEKVLPNLAAQVHVAVVEEVVNAIIGNLPTLIRFVQQQGNKEQELESRFFSMWPSLKDDEGKATAEQLLAAYVHASQGKKLDLEKIMRDVGIAAMTTLQRPIQPSGASLPVPAPAPSTPAAPFTPAAPGASGGGSQQLGVWATMAEELLHED